MGVTASRGKEHAGKLPKEVEIKTNETSILHLPNKYVRETKEGIENICPKLEIIKEVQENTVYDEYKSRKKATPGRTSTRMNPAEV